MLSDVVFYSTLMLTVFTLASLLTWSVWWVRACDFPRLQIATLLSCNLVAACFILDFTESGNWGIVAVTVLCLIYQAHWIIPYTRLYPAEVDEVKDNEHLGKIALLNANVLMTNRNSQPLLSAIDTHKPDIVVVLESDQWWEDQLVSIEEDYPFSVKCPLDNLYGMHVYSRLRLEDPHLEFLVEKGVPSVHTRVELESGVKVRLHCLHPAPPSPTENEESTERDVELIVVARKIAEHDQPTIVTGDLNDVAWSRTTRLFKRVSGLLDPRIGRGMFNTFHADHWFMRWPLDHIFHSEHFRLSRIERLPHSGSDHFPLLTKLVLVDPSENGQQGNKDEEPEWLAKQRREKHVDESDVPE